jgi:hypothetical protein
MRLLFIQVGVQKNYLENAKAFKDSRFFHFWAFLSIQARVEVMPRTISKTFVSVISVSISAQERKNNALACLQRLHCTVEMRNRVIFAH